MASARRAGIPAAMTSTIVLAGASGDLGARIARALGQQSATVRALVRPGKSAAQRAALDGPGVTVVEVDSADADALTRACAGASCVVSALAGLRDVVVDAQVRVLDAAVAAGVPRFIPSDYSIDFTALPAGSNRNLDLRREFHEQLERAPVAATSIYNGAFTDMLTGQAPFILYGPRRTLCWGDADQKMDFTTIDDVAAYTARVALDDSAPRSLRIAGDRVSARDLARIMGDVTGTPFRVLRPCGLGLFSAVIAVTRALTPTSTDLYPPWQGMQYMRNMFSGLALPASLDNDRYPGLQWTSTRDVLTAHVAAMAGR